MKPSRKWAKYLNIAFNDLTHHMLGSTLNQIITSRWCCIPQKLPKEEPVSHCTNIVVFSKNWKSETVSLSDRWTLSPPIQWITQLVEMALIAPNVSPCTCRKMRLRYLTSRFLTWMNTDAQRGMKELQMIKNLPIWRWRTCLPHLFCRIWSRLSNRLGLRYQKHWSRRCRRLGWRCQQPWSRRCRGLGWRCQQPWSRRCRGLGWRCQQHWSRWSCRWTNLRPRSQPNRIDGFCQPNFTILDLRLSSGFFNNGLFNFLFSFRSTRRPKSRGMKRTLQTTWTDYRYLVHARIPLTLDVSFPLSPSRFATPKKRWLKQRWKLKQLTTTFEHL